MPAFTIHVEDTYVIEAESAKEAREHYEANHDRPSSSAFHIVRDGREVFVTDEMGDEVEA